MDTSCSNTTTQQIKISNQNKNTMINQTSLISISSFFQQTLQKIDLNFFFFLKIQSLHLFITLIIIFVTITINSLHQKKRYGLPVWPILGMLPSLIHAGLRSEIYDRVTTVLEQQNGTFTYKGPWLCSSLTAIVTSNTQNIEYLLKTNFSNFPKGHLARENLRDLLGDGIFNADDDSWYQQRKVSSVQFHSHEFRNMTTESLLELVHTRLIPLFEQKIIDSDSFDLQEIFLRLTFDNVCMIAFGVDPRCLSLGLPDIPFARAFEDATERSLLRLFIPSIVWRLMRFLNLGGEKRLKKSIEQVDEFVEGVMSTRKKELSLVGFENNKCRRSDILTVFMGLKNNEGKPYSNKFLRDIVVNFILAGRDTSSVALSWFFWLLNQNPVIEDKIVEELCRIVAHRQNFGDDEGDKSCVVFGEEEMKRMDYLQAALSESLRLYPSVPMDRKQVVEDDAFPDGTILKKERIVIYSIYSMGRMESIWGKDCREFKPERWLKDGQFISESPYKFTAFNGGPRLCLGKDFAYYQMKFVAASIIYRYRVKVVENHPVVPKLAMTMYMKYGLKVTLKRRDETELSKHFKQMKAQRVK